MDEQQLHGIVEKVIYKNTESGFVVCSLKVNSRESVIITGSLQSVYEGEQLTVSGSWSFHAKFGRQFLVSKCVAQLPTHVIGIQKYLSSGLIKGIGPAFAQRVVDHFKEKTLEIIDQSPELLLKIEGIGQKRLETIIKAWQEQKSISQIMVFLQARDVSPSFAAKIFKAYGHESLSKIQQNPYRLVDDIWGVGFKSADKLALKLGFEPHSLYRVCAGIIHAISQALGLGHLYLTVAQAKESATEHLGLQGDEVDSLLKRALHELYNQEKIKLISKNEHHYLTLPQYYFSEKGIASKIQHLQEKAPSNSVFNVDEVYAFLSRQDAQGISLNEDQQRGILACIQNKITIITGGPGTGKTTLIKKLLEVLELKKVRFRLAAPTGRAAKRMFESTRRSTETLHRLLEFTPQLMAFSRNERNALELDFLVVDESSMIDVFLMHSLLRALPDHAQIVFLGDVDQLPSVGAGNVLSDLIGSGKVEVVRLTQIFRQAQDSMIIVNAHRVNRGEFPTNGSSTGMRDFVFIKEEAPENVFGILKELYTKKLAARGIKPEDSVVLVPMNKGIVGAARLNQELQNILNPVGQEEKQVSRYGVVYKKGDRVMQIRNNYDKFVFNGDFGLIVDINHEDQKLFIEFGDRLLEYDFDELDELTLSYAISIHKSQGSEFSAVIIPLFMQHFILLQRNLLYTAITRAKRMCILIGQPKAIAMAIKNNKGIERLTFLKEYLTTDLKAR